MSWQCLLFCTNISLRFLLLFLFLKIGLSLMIRSSPGKLLYDKHLASPNFSFLIYQMGMFNLLLYTFARRSSDLKGKTPVSAGRKQHASFAVANRQTDRGIRECLWNKDDVIVYFQQGSGWGKEHLQPGSPLSCHSDWADTKPYSGAGIFVQLTFSGPVIMQHVCTLSTHCSQVAGMVTKNPTYFKIFLFANPRQCH